MTARELGDIQATYEAAEKDYERTRTARNRAVRRALEEGWTHAQIAGATGLSRGRIGQIAQSRD